MPVVTCWERADLLALSFVKSNCKVVTFPLVSWVKCVVSIPDLCPLSYNTWPMQTLNLDLNGLKQMDFLKLIRSELFFSVIFQ